MTRPSFLVERTRDPFQVDVGVGGGAPADPLTGAPVSRSAGAVVRPDALAVVPGHVGLGPPLRGPLVAAERGHRTAEVRGRGVPGGRAVAAATGRGARRAAAAARTLFGQH